MNSSARARDNQTLSENAEDSARITPEEISNYIQQCVDRVLYHEVPRHHVVILPTEIRDKRFTQLNELISAGWGDTNGNRIPNNWRVVQAPAAHWNSNESRRVA